MPEAPSETALQFAEVAALVPGIGTALAALVGFISSFTGDPQAANPFMAPARFAGGLYDPPTTWRPGEPGCAFQGLLWGYPVSQWDVNEHYRRQRGGELHWAFQDSRSQFDKENSSPFGSHIKGIYERLTIDVVLVPKRVAIIKKQWENPPAAPVFYYSTVPTFGQWKAHAFQVKRQAALDSGKVIVLFGSPQWQATAWRSEAHWVSLHKPGLLEGFWKTTTAANRQRQATERTDWSAFRAALILERDRQAFLQQAAEVAEAAAIAAYDAALAAAQSGHAQPPAPPTAPMHLVPNPSDSDTSAQLLNLGLPDQAAKPVAQAAAVGGAGILALLLL